MAGQVDAAHAALPNSAAMPRLYVPETGKTIGEITEDQLQFLVDHLEEEHSDDQDYYISQDTLDLFRDEGCDPELLTLLQTALGESEDMDIAWE